MTHEQIQELLSAYIDGDLRPDERDEVQAHLEGCAECREELALLELTVEALHDLPDIEAPAGFADAVLDRVEAEAPTVATAAGARSDAKVIPFRRARRAALVAAPLALAAAAVLVVGVVWWTAPWRYVTTSGADQPLTVAEAEDVAFDGRADGDGLAANEPARARSESKEEASREIGAGGFIGDLEDDGLVDDFTSLDEPVAEQEGRLAEAAPSPDSVIGPQPAAPPADAALAGATAGGSDGAYFAPWERSEGDALADTGGIAPSTASPTRSATGAGTGEGLGRTAGTVGKRERERLAQEDAALRSMYGEDSGVELDALVDAEPLEEAGEDAWSDEYRDSDRREQQAQSRSAAGLAFAAEDDEDADYGRRDDADDFLGDAVSDEMDFDRSEEEEAVYEETVEAARATRGRPSGRLSRDRSSVRKKAAERAPAVAEAPAEPEDLPAGAAQSIAVTEERAADTTADLSAAAPPNQAEWRLHTTDPAVLFQLLELCAGDTGLACVWTSPNSGPVSLNAQKNYQQVEFTLARAGYATLQSRMRSLGNLLVHSEDIALAGPADRITVRLVVEYLP